MKLKTVEKKITLAGGKIAGGNPEHGRVENDYYATNPKAVEMLFERYEVRGNTFLEPCVGGGHIAKAVDKLIGDKLEETTYLDIVDRGYPNTIVKDFLQYKTNKRYDIIISNPPYSLAQEFIEKSLSLLSSKGHCIMFLKLQFLEGAKRKEFLKNIHPNTYMFLEIGWLLGIMVVKLTQIPVRDGRQQCVTHGLFGRKAVIQNPLLDGFS